MCGNGKWKMKARRTYVNEAMKGRTRHLDGD